MVKTNRWSRLDNAAKIFPSTSRKSDTKVFRFSCELTEKVVPEILNKALNKNLDDFPGYRSVLKRGLFWYYLEDSDLPAFCSPEYLPICSPIYDKNAKTLLFNITYYENRINLEVYHALADGTGALQFLRRLVFYYLILKYPDKFKNVPIMDYSASDEQKMDDSFKKYYTKHKGKKQLKSPTAYKIKGIKMSENRIRITEGVAPVKEIMKKAHEYGVSMTVFLTAVFIDAIHKNMRVTEEVRPVKLTIPVNLRNYFDSQSARNFFSTMNAGYDYKTGDGSFDDIIKVVGDTFKKSLTPEAVKEKMDSYSSVENNIFARATPLIIKDICLRIVHDVSSKDATGAVSNIGKVTMPDEFSRYIRLFDVFVSTEKVQICMCSYRDNLTLSITSPFVSVGIQREFFRALTGFGIPVEISDNRLE